MPASHGCWRRSTCRRSRRPASRFPLSMLERVIEEQARGSPEKAEAIRRSVQAQLGGDIRTLVPGSPQAAELKRVLIEQGAWSQYLEVGIGPDAEIFTKAQPMAAVGHGMEAGPASDLELEQPGARGGAGGQLEGRDRRRHARQRRQPARRGGPLGAAAVQGQGQQCLDGHRARSCASSTAVHARHRAAHRGEPEGRGRGRLHARGAIVDGRRSPATRPTSSSRCWAGITSIPTGPCCSSAPCSRRSKDRGAKGQGFTHKKGDVTTISRAGARRARQPHDALHARRRPGSSARAR